ncbi:MAG: SDR family oxidoreductase [Candidatus Bathyarchaeota archaeon]|nr:SDR family oxidoreductase [Candidatus Bathyarchaeota archaeon]MDH5686883.1 SDR family oxidoreductase [Candidatus Bathyarchaeota archaeon]
MEDEIKLVGKVAIVTGGGKGIGRAISLTFAREGADVSLAARSTDLMEEVAREIRAMGRRALVNTTDITKIDQVDKMAKRTHEEFGRIDILVNNSGIAGPTAYVHEITPEEWDETFNVNLRGAFLCCRAVVPIMIKQGGGRIINIASMTGKRPLPMRTPYCATKLGLIGFTRSLASELGKFNINANAICPGAVQGPRIERVVRNAAEAEGTTEEEIRRRFVSPSPLGRMVSADDVARLAVFLASDASKNITGQDVNVTAGVVMF